MLYLSRTKRSPTVSTTRKSSSLEGKDNIDWLHAVDSVAKECVVHIVQAEELLLSFDSNQIFACKHQSEFRSFQWWGSSKRVVLDVACVSLARTLWYTSNLDMESISHCLPSLQP